MIFTDRLRRHASVHGEHIAVVTGNEQLTYRDLLDQVARKAKTLGESGLGESGLGASHTVGICIRSEVQHLITTLAVMMVGADQIALASHDSPAIHDMLSTRVGVDVVLSDDGKIFRRVKHNASDKVRQDSARHPANEGSTLYFRTSGTTGDPNIIPLNEQQLALQAERHADYEDERLLRLASIEHNPSRRQRLFCLWAGGTNVFVNGGRLDLKSLIKQHRITCLDFSRMHLSELLEMEVGKSLSKVKLRPGGSAVPYSLRKLIQENVSENLYVRYAATECGGIAMALPHQHDPEEPVGTPLDGVQLEVVNESGSQASDGEIGEIRIRASGMANEYLDAPEVTTKKFRGGWFYPGDMGYFRSDGCLVVKGRKDDTLILNGISIFPLEVEHVLEEHPAVHCAGVIGLPSKHYGEIPVAAVEVRPGFELTSSELKIYARERLGLRSPRRIIFVDYLPRNAQGKVVKKTLGELFEQDFPYS